LLGRIRGSLLHVVSLVGGVASSAAALAGLNVTGVPSFVNAPTPDGASGTNSLGESLIDPV
jgi:hypothetical protein